MLTFSECLISATAYVDWYLKFLESSQIMMERLREGVNSLAVKIILGLIILSFVFAGVGSYLVGGGNNSAAKVGNAEISRAQFEQAYQNERNRMQSQMGEYFSNLMGDPQYVQSFRKNILDQMINDVLIEQYAESMGMRISDEQIRQIILGMNEFQKDGKFDQDIYQATLRRAGFTADAFAGYLRHDLLRNQVMNALQGSEFTLAGETDEISKLIAQERVIREITLDIKAFADEVTVTDEELNAYYKDHPEQYTRPEQYKVSYLELSAEQLKQAAPVSDDEAQKYYQDHLEKYSTKEQRQVRHILIKDDEAKIDELSAQLADGADFATLAKENSEDVGSAKAGGDLGWVEKGVMAPEFEEAAFALEKAGDVSAVVKTDFGYHIIQLEAVKVPDVKPYADVAEQIKVELADQHAIDNFYDLQTKLEKVAFESPDSLADSAVAIDGKVIHTDYISQQDAPEVLRTPAVLAAFDTPEVKLDGLNSEVIQVAPEHVVVVRVDDVRHETLLPLEEVKAQVEQQLAQVKGEQQAIELANKVVAELNQSNQDVLAEHKLEFGDTQTIDRSSPLAANVFAMAKPEDGQSVYGQAKDAQGDIVIVAVDKITVKAESGYTQQIGMQLQRQSNQQELMALLSSLRNEIDITYYGLNQQQ